MPGFSGHGTRFWAQRNSGTCDRIGEILDVSGPSNEAGDVDVTTNDSPNHFKEFVPNLLSGGDLSFPALFDTARYNRVQSYARNQSVLKMLVLLTTEPNALITCGGYIKSLGQETQMEEAIRNEMGFMVTGAVRYLLPLTGELTLTAGTGEDSTSDVPPGDDLSNEIGFRTAADAGTNNEGFGTLAGEDGAVVERTDIVRLYHDSTLASRGLYLKVDGFDPALNSEFYLLIDNVMYRFGQTGGVDGSGTDFIYTWGGSIGEASPFTDGAEATVQLFSA